MASEEDDHNMVSLCSRRKKPSVSISCCFNGGGTTKHLRRASLDATSSSCYPSPRISSPSMWFKSGSKINNGGGDHLPDQIRGGKCRNFFTLRTTGRHRRHSSAEFSYDPLSYALNFDEDPPSPHLEYFPTSRLQVSPPPKRSSSSSSTVGVNDDLRRGFEALFINMRGAQAQTADETLHIRKNKQLAGVAAVKRSLEKEDVTSLSSMGINSSKREILVHLG